MKPYKLTPFPHEAIWGGKRLIDAGKKPLFAGADNLAESWELSFVAGAEARCEDGTPVTEAFSRADFGKAAAGMPAFPVLTKFIDAKSKLSVQVHPSDAYALAREGQYGKTEMWYVVAADRGAGVYVGLRRKTSKEELARAVREGRIEELLAFHEARAGDVFFIPAGTIHAIGGGVLLYEIQQNSTLTYRLYDYGRRDASGAERPLHLEKALEVAETDAYRPFPKEKNQPEIIGKCKYFLAKRYRFCGELTLFVSEESYLCITVIEGYGRIGEQKMRPFDTFFLPAPTSGCETVRVLADREMTLIAVSTEREAEENGSANGTHMNAVKGTV